MVSFMSNTGEHLPKFPVPQEHKALLREIDHSDLVELSEIFSPDDTGWRSVINQERLAREQEIDSIRAHIPPAESPPYGPEADPAAHIDLVRQFNRRSASIYDPNTLRDEKRQIRAFADETVAQNRTAFHAATGNKVYLNQEELSDFFNSSLRNVVLISRMRGLAAFKAQKYKTVRQYLPTVRINDPEVRYQIRNQAVTRTQIEAAKEAVLDLSHTTPLPDFFQMAPGQQKAIVATLGAEWIELCKITAQHDPRALSVQALRSQGSLSYHSVETLRQAIEQNPSVKPSEICRLFLRHPQKFEAGLKAARQDADNKALLKARQEAEKKRQQEAAGFYESPKAVSGSADTEVDAKAAPAAKSESRSDELLATTGPITLIKNYPSANGRLTKPVQAITDKGELWFAYPTDQQFEKLAELCTVLPANATYSSWDVRMKLGRIWGPAEVDEKLNKLIEAMPPGVITVHGVAMTIGNIILAGRKTTAEDVSNEYQRKYEEKKANIDKDKVSVISQDHARITVNNPKTGEQLYYLPLDRGGAILAARVIALLRDRTADTDAAAFVEGREAASSVWAKMPTTERELFTTRRNDILGSSATIRAHVLDTMRNVTRLIGVTRETSGERFKLEAAVAIAFHEDSPEPSELKGFRPMYPAGTDRELIKRTALGPIPEAALSTASILLEHQVDSSEPLSHNQALGILDLITDSEVKRAIRYQIKAMNLTRTSASVLEILRGQVQRSLGEGFENTWRNRMIAGNHATGDNAVFLTASQLPVITNVARLITRKWHIGPPLA
jgi:hypothetical protein